MDLINHLKGLFESIQDYKMKVLLVFIFKKDDALIKEYDFFKKMVYNVFMMSSRKMNEQKENYLHYLKFDEDSLIEKVCNI